MMKIIDFSKKNGKKNLLDFLEKRRSGFSVETSVVDKIIKDVKKNKNKAVIKYEKKFSKNNKIKPSKKEIYNAIRSLDKKVIKAIDLAFNRIEKFHKLQKVSNIKFIDSYNNKIEYRHLPLKSVGIYIPANLPSSLLMNAIPAKIAGVKRIVLANPRTNGKLNSAIMYVAKKCGIKEIINVGGAQAIASLAYIQKVDKIVGPGNDFVAKAKQKVFGQVGTEGMIAGPSEVTIIADSKSDVKQISTSMAAQSEHGINSQSILISKDKNILIKCDLFLRNILEKFLNKKTISESINKNGLLLYAKSDSQIIQAVNLISPEHLEILTTNTNKFKNKIYNAGSIGIGAFSPVAASDYTVGTNHTLGTLGSSKFASGLNLNDFYKKISQFTLSKKGIEVIGKEAITLAEYENLQAHALSIKSRIQG